ncbi:MAG: 4-hydroxyphenylacetate decarboxylase small subunit [Phascolarctobacterium faecium]
MAKNNHADCRNFTPIDVAKGICHANNDSIIFDGETCPMFTPIAKCKCCKCFIKLTKTTLVSAMALRKRLDLR